MSEQSDEALVECLKCERTGEDCGEHAPTWEQLTAYWKAKAEDLTRELAKAKADAEMLAEALGELKGQVEQARDGFDHWPYNNSDSMKAVLARSDEALASYREKTNG